MAEESEIEIIEDTRAPRQADITGTTMTVSKPPTLSYCTVTCVSTKKRSLVWAYFHDSESLMQKEVTCNLCQEK